MKIIFNYFFLPFLRPSASPLRSAASDFPFRPLSRTSARRQRRLRPTPSSFQPFLPFPMPQRIKQPLRLSCHPLPFPACRVSPARPSPQGPAPFPPVRLSPAHAPPRRPARRDCGRRHAPPARSHAFPSHHVTIIAGHSPPPHRNAGVAVEAARPTPFPRLSCEKICFTFRTPRAPTFCPSPPTLPPSASSFSGRPAPPPSPAFPAVPRLPGPSFSAEACPISAGPPFYRSRSPRALPRFALRPALIPRSGTEDLPQREIPYSIPHTLFAG